MLLCFLASSTAEAEGGEENEEVFISIQAFPALLDVSPSCEVVAVSCGSRHTAAVTSNVFLPFITNVIPCDRDR